MKLRDILPGNFAVLESGTVVAVARRECNFSRCIDGISTIDILDCAEARPLAKEDIIHVGDRGSLLVKNPEPVKDDGVHPSELKVGQLGRVIAGGGKNGCWVTGDFILRRHRDSFMNIGGIYAASMLPESIRVHPYPIGSKIVPQADGSIVVEEPEVKPLAWDDLEAGQFFVDGEGELAIKDDDDGLTWLSNVNGKFCGEHTGDVCFGSIAKPITRLTNAEAAAIIAGQ